MRTKNLKVCLAALAFLLATEIPSFARVIYVDADADFLSADDGTSWAAAQVLALHAEATFYCSCAEVALLAKPPAIYVDDDAPADPAPGDPDTSDPQEDGSQSHPFDAIQEAIDAAEDGETIVVLEGTYTGTGNREMDFGGKVITVRSKDPNDAALVAATIIDCQGTEEENHRGFNFHSAETRDCVLEGFTITGGVHGSGAGIMCRNGASPTIANNVIQGNHVTFDADGGAAIACRDGTAPLILGNIIRDNHCEPGGGGGGIICYDAGAVIIRNNMISGNSASSGGGICIQSPGVVIEDCTFTDNFAIVSMGGAILAAEIATIKNCTFSRNSADHGGAVHAYRTKTTISGCVFTHNSADYLGGALMRCWGTVSNCIFAHNTAGDEGGGLEGCDANIVNCTIAHNTAGSLGGGLRATFGGGAISNSIAWGNWPDQIGGSAWTRYSDIQGGWPGEGNLDLDPCFADPNNGDYHLLSERGRYWAEHDVWVLDKVTSPCIDAGDPYDDPSAEPMPNGDLVNMGAYGGTPYASMSEWALRGDINHDGIVNMIDFSIFADYWLQPSLRAREIDNRIACANNLRALRRALLIYANDYDDEYPTADQWCDLLLQYESDHVTEEMFVCPSAEAGRSHYAINPNVTDASCPPDMVLLFEARAGWNQFGGPELLAPENHQGEGSHILFHDGHVEFVESERFDELRWE